MPFIYSVLFIVTTVLRLPSTFCRAPRLPKIFLCVLVSKIVSYGGFEMSFRKPTSKRKSKAETATLDISLPNEQEQVRRGC